MSTHPKQMWLPFGEYTSPSTRNPTSAAHVRAALEKVTIQDLLDDRVVQPAQVPELEAKMMEAQVCAWEALGLLCFKPAVSTDTEIRVEVETLHRQRPDLDRDALLRETLELYKGAVSPDSIRRAVGQLFKK